MFATSDGGLANITAESSSNFNVVTGSIAFNRSRGTQTFKQDVQNGDSLGFLVYRGYAEGAYRVAGNIEMQVATAPTTGGDFASRMLFKVRDSSGATVAPMTIHESEQVEVESLIINTAPTATAPTTVLTRDAATGEVHEASASDIQVADTGASRLTTLDTGAAAQNLNQVAWIDVNFGQHNGSFGAATFVGGNIIIASTGLYTLNFSGAVTSTGQRNSIEAAIFVNGVQESVSAITYIRFATGHNKDNVVCTTTEVLNAGDIVTVKFRRAPGALNATATNFVAWGKTACKLDIIRLRKA